MQVWKTAEDSSACTVYTNRLFRHPDVQKYVTLELTRYFTSNFAGHHVRTRKLITTLTPPLSCKQGAFTLLDYMLQGTVTFIIQGGMHRCND
jgi:hypothetical protein